MHPRVSGVRRAARGMWRARKNSGDPRFDAPLQRTRGALGAFARDLAVSDPFRDRLRRLRKEAAPPESKPGLPAWFLERARPEVARPTETPLEREHNARKLLSAPHSLEHFENSAGRHAARITTFECAHFHGRTRLDAIDRVERETWSRLAHDAAIGALDPRRAVYLDIETTGLSGGAGTKAFLVGLGRFVDDRFELWQGFLRGPEEEPALLTAVAERLREGVGIVSFFGKSFDRHRLEDKMRMFRIPPPFAERVHFDLFHPCRRLYAGVFPNTRLGTVERELCGVQRASDLPGSFAPAAWFDFLAGRPHLLEDVFRHNADDILSLVTLAAHLGRVHETERQADEPIDVARARGLARICAREKRWSECVEWVRRSRTWSSTAMNDREFVELEDNALRRLGRDGERIELLRALCDDVQDAVGARAAFDLSRLLERQEPELAGSARERARRWAETHPDVPGMRGLLRHVRSAMQPPVQRARGRAAPNSGNAAE